MHSGWVGELRVNIFTDPALKRWKKKKKTVFLRQLRKSAIRNFSKCSFYQGTGAVSNEPCCYSEAKSCLTLCSIMDCSTPGSSVLHYLPEFALTHVDWVGYAIQPSHPLSMPFSSYLHSFPASGAFPMSWLFASSAQITGTSASASVLPMNIQGWLPLGLTGLILQSKGLSRVFSSLLH